LLLAEWLCRRDIEDKKMDLNELPPEFDYDFLMCHANPLYCTQAVVGEGTVHEIEHVPNQDFR
jgi:hypothetical protein